MHAYELIFASLQLATCCDILLFGPQKKEWRIKSSSKLRIDVGLSDPAHRWHELEHAYSVGSGVKEDMYVRHIVILSCLVRKIRVKMGGAHMLQKCSLIRICELETCLVIAVVGDNRISLQI